MTISNTQIAELSVLSQGRNPQFVTLPTIEPEGLEQGNGPKSLTAGVDLQDATVALLAVRLREDAARHQVDIFIDWMEMPGTFTIDIEGMLFTYESSFEDGKVEVLEGLAQAIAMSEAPFETTVYPGDLDNQPRLRLSPNVPFSYETKVYADYAQMSLEQDATSASFRVWLLPEGADTWYVPAGGTVIDQSINWMERAGAAGIQRAHIEILQTDGKVTPLIGPCLLEE